jgi:hypothetical protein
MATDTLNYQNPWEHTAPGVLGVNRDTMLQNELLLRVSKVITLFRELSQTYLTI